MNIIQSKVGEMDEFRQKWQLWTTFQNGWQMDEWFTKVDDTLLDEIGALLHEEQPWEALPSFRRSSTPSKEQSSGSPPNYGAPIRWKISRHCTIDESATIKLLIDSLGIYFFDSSPSVHDSCSSSRFMGPELQTLAGVSTSASNVVSFYSNVVIAFAVCTSMFRT